MTHMTHTKLQHVKTLSEDGQLLLEPPAKVKYHIELFHESLYTSGGLAPEQWLKVEKNCRILRGLTDVELLNLHRDGVDLPLILKDGRQVIIAFTDRTGGFVVRG